MSETETEKNPDIIVCPRCNIEEFTTKPGYAGNVAYPALSRVNNTSHICSECGVTEALRNMRNVRLQGPKSWPLEHPWDISS